MKRSLKDRVKTYIHGLMLPTHEMKSTHKFNGRKGVEDEVLEFPKESCRVTLAKRGFSPGS